MAIEKATLRIPTKHQYAYIEVEVTGDVETIIQTYIHFTETYKSLQNKFDSDKTSPF